jgi:DNA-binding NtrC family response regulator
MVTDNRTRTNDPRWPIEREVFEALAQSSDGLVIVNEGGDFTAAVQFARTVHDAGPRGPRPFIHLVCDDMPADVLASELFGHGEDRSAGRFRSKPSVAETAIGGTLCLANADRMPAALQPQLSQLIDDSGVRVIAIIRCIGVFPEFLKSFARIRLGGELIPPRMG